MIWIGITIGSILLWLPMILTGDFGFLVFDVIGWGLYEKHTFIAMILGYALYTLVPSLACALITKTIPGHREKSLRNIFLKFFKGLNIALIASVGIIFLLLSQIDISF